MYDLQIIQTFNLPVILNVKRKWHVASSLFQDQWASNNSVTCKGQSRNAMEVQPLFRSRSEVGVHNRVAEIIRHISPTRIFGSQGLCALREIYELHQAEAIMYASCAEVLSVCQSVKEDLEAVLDPGNGFAPRMRQLCEDQ